MLYRIVKAGLTGVLLLALTSCSNNNPVSPVDTSPLLTEQGTEGDPVVLQARIHTTDQNRRMLTLAGTHDTVVASHNCEIVRFSNPNETPVPFSSIGPLDSVRVEGQRQQNGYVLAYRLRVCTDTCWDVAFRDTIVDIDHAAGWFRVAGRTETIMVDDATIIWTNEVEKQWRNQQAEAFGFTTAGTGPAYHHQSWDTALEFADLSVGDVVAVKADIVDASTLLAVAVKLAACSDLEQRCIEFEAVLAGVDVDTRIVTFDGLDWIGWVCPGATLTDPDGVEILLADFAPGDAVQVRGIPGEEDQLKICRMQKL